MESRVALTFEAWGRIAYSHRVRIRSQFWILNLASDLPHACT